MNNTPITLSAIETVGAYVRALDAYQYQTQFKDPFEDGYDEGRYNAIIRLAASAEACQRTSQLDWHDENGTFVAPGAGNVASAAVDLILNHPDKESLFAEVESGETLELDNETWEQIAHVIHHTQEQKSRSGKAHHHIKEASEVILLRGGFGCISVPQKHVG